MKLKKKKFYFADNLRTIGKQFVVLMLLLTGFAINAQVVSITSTDLVAAEVEGGAPNGATITISRAPAAAAGFTTVNLVRSGTAVSNQDYTIPPTVIILNAVNPSVTLPVSIIEDDLVEETETITITLGAIGGGTPNPAANSVTINLANSPQDVGVFTLEMDDGAAAEEGSDRGRFILRLDKQNGTGKPLTVAYSLAGSAIAPGNANADYTTQGQAIFTFPLGTLARALNIIPVDDALPEADETAVLILDNPQLGNPAANTNLFSYTPASK